MGPGIISEARERRFRIALAVVLVVALALRIAVRAAAGPADFFANGYGFYMIPATQLAEGHGYVDAQGAALTERPPLYALLLALLRGYRDFWPILLVQALISTGTVACAALIARHLSGRRAALIAAAITALYPYYVRHDTAMQESGLLTFLTALAMLLLLYERKRRGAGLALVAGTILGLATLTRPTIVPMIVLGPAWLLIPDCNATAWRRRALTGLLALVAGLAVLSPWLIRQHEVLGHWALTTQGGRALFVGNNPDTFSVYPLGSIDASQAQAQKRLNAEYGPYFDKHPLSAPANDMWLRARALAYIRANPGHFLVGAVRKNLAAFGPLPSPRHGLAENLTYALSYGPVLALALVGLWRERRRWRLYALFHAQFLLFAVSTAILWGHTSHRSYLDVYLIVFAALAVVPWIRRFTAPDAT